MTRERPILFAGQIVRAILAGTKTQTRRIANIPDGGFVQCLRDGTWEHSADGGFDQDVRVVGARYRVGDRLWVRESFTEWPAGDQLDVPCIPPTTTYEYAADHPGRRGWTPSIHMPRRASRIILEVTGVRVERLQSITEEDARAEGVTIHYDEDCWSGSYRLAFEYLWGTIKGFPGDSRAKPGASWAYNPWVWVVSFRRLP